MSKDTQKKYGRGKHPNSHKHGLFKKGHKTNVGRACSKKTKGKIRKANKGKQMRGVGWKHTERTREKIKEGKLGSKNPNWKGGITPLYKRIFKSFKYRQWRSDVFTRDDFTCQECGEKDCLEAHHIKRFSEIIAEYKIKTLEEALNCEELWNINNGKTLCKKCHKKTESYGKHFKKR